MKTKLQKVMENPGFGYHNAVELSALSPAEVRALKLLGLPIFTRAVPTEYGKPLHDAPRVEMIKYPDTETLHRFTQLTPRQQLATVMEKMVVMARQKLALLTALNEFVVEVKAELGADAFKKEVSDEPN